MACKRQGGGCCVISGTRRVHIASMVRATTKLLRGKSSMASSQGASEHLEGERRVIVREVAAPQHTQTALGPLTSSANANHATQGKHWASQQGMGLPQRQARQPGTLHMTLL